MANLQLRAADELRKQNEKMRKMRDTRKREIELAASSAAMLLGAGLAGVIDAKWGDGEVAEVGGVPINGLLGGGIALGAGAFDFPYRRELGAGALGLLGGAIYRYVAENVKFDEEEE